MTILALRVRSTLLSAPDVSRLSSLKRPSSLFSQGQVADAVYLVENGLIKLTRTSISGSRTILSICGAGHLVGEEVLSDDAQTHDAEAEVLTVSTLYRIPRDSIRRIAASNSDVAGALITYLVDRKRALARKVELLSLFDVEYRVRHYLAELSAQVKPAQEGDAYQLPITQLELADLIGATRETTSTTLNQLERRGLVRLSRRLLTVPDPLSLMYETKTSVSHRNGATA